MLDARVVKVINYLLYFLIIVVPLIYFPTGMYPFQVIKTAILQSFIEIIFALWLGLAIFYKEYRPRLTPLSLSLLLFIVIVLLSVIFGIDWRVSLWSTEARTMGFVALLHFIALFFVLSSLKNRISWNIIFILSFIAASLVGAAALIQKITPDAPSFLQPLLKRFLLTEVQGTERISATFGNPAFMAGYLLFNFFIGVWLFVGQKVRNLKFIGYFVGLVLILSAIVFSQTRGEILALGIGIFILLAYTAFFKKSIFSESALLKKISLGLFVFIIVAGSVFWLTKNNSFWRGVPGFSRLTDISSESSGIRERLIAWQVSLKAFKDRPILGWGFENFRIVFNKYYDPKILSIGLVGTYWDKPHNILLEYLTTTGILGLLAYLGIFGAIFYSLFKKQSNYNQLHAEGINCNTEHKITTPFIAAVIIAYFIQNLFLFDTIGTYFMFFLLLGFIDSQKRINADYTRINVGNQHQPAEISINQLDRGNRKYTTNAQIVLSILILFSLIGVYYNYQIFQGSRYEYWGVNYFANLYSGTALADVSLAAFRRAVTIKTPYIDDIKRSFANVVKQAYEEGTPYPNLSELQKELVKYLNSVIERHPEEFLNYLTLAEFKQTFYAFDSNYVKESEELTKKALTLSPKRQQAYYVLAKAKLLDNNIKGAYNIFREAVAINPKAGDPHFLFGLMAYGLGDSKTGEAEITEAARLGRGPLNSNEAVVLANFAGDYHNDYKKAIELYKLAYLIAPFENEANKFIRLNLLLKLAVAYYYDGDQQNAKNTFLQIKDRGVNLKYLPIYPELQPVLKELGVEE